MARPEPGEIIKNGADLFSYMVRKREPEVDGDLPSIAELRSKVEEIDAHHPEESTPESEKAKEGLSLASQSVSDNISQGTACLPCCIDHYSTCAGLVSDEAIRMAKRHGIDNEEVISRILSCRSQLNAMEREDLSVEKIANLPEWEKKIVILAQNEGANIRHELSNIKSVSDLESVAIKIKDNYRKIGEAWLKSRIANMSEEEKAKVRERTEEILIDKELEQ